MYAWKALAACRSKDSEVQWDASCLQAPLAQLDKGLGG